MITITKNQKFFDELSKFNAGLSRLLDEKYGWTDKLVYRSEDAGISQPGRRSKGSENVSTQSEDQKMGEAKMGEDR